MGTCFSESALFISAVLSAKSKASLAIGTTLPLLYKLNPDSWRSVDKLFENLTLSTFLYTAQIWSLRYFDEVEKIHTKFFKAILNVPQNTPNYAIRLETGSPHLALRIFRMTLNWIVKILGMEEEQYPRICFEKLKTLADRNVSNIKYNWALQVKNFFIDLDEEVIWNSLTLDSLISNKMRLVKKFEQFLFEKDTIKLQSSSSLKIYPWLPLYSGTQPYLQSRISLSYVKIIAQIRLLNDYNTRLIKRAIL